jgi:hypothetical protein
MAPPPNLDLLLNSLAYPGQSTAEGEVIRAWLLAVGAQYDAIEFHVHVGKGAELPDGLDPAIAKFGLEKTQKKIDVLAVRDGRYTIVEAKVKLNLGVLGQLYGYRSLFLEDRPLDVVEQLIAIARRADPDVIAVLTGGGVRVELFQDLPEVLT